MWTVCLVWQEILWLVSWLVSWFGRPSVYIMILEIVEYQMLSGGYQCFIDWGILKTFLYGSSNYSTNELKYFYKYTCLTLVKITAICFFDLIKNLHSGRSIRKRANCACKSWSNPSATEYGNLYPLFRCTAAISFNERIKSTAT